ncbi:VTT domain-containing protein [Methanosphaerula palustris]|uniref:SNARE associated Golgi protein n=1 Tax=Methanosphaerula palustris (strain ATCC BAA-1556 / DSM 19958 / E1-9c) TaxID=521011 RepID=B8GID2_METPE|nr:VTT domain-containing protein [Methanosphaerula palustris]ACL15483.1 SNARE associated Golgi protein [Methanosphaerula palustris E1-9c]
MDILLFLIDFILHIDTHLNLLIQQYGIWTYLLLFLVIFIETGAVVTPFLPGDSLLFIAGALSVTGSLKVEILIPLLIVAAVLGDHTNYWIGHRLGGAFLTGEHRFVKKEYIEQAEFFFAKHGSKAIFFARFVPFVRTFIPFLSGVGQMNYRVFTIYELIGSVSWVVLFVLGGYFFGNVPVVKDNLTLTIILILIVTVGIAVIGGGKAMVLKRKN